MQLQLYRYNEPLVPEEVAFLTRKEVRERKQFYKIIQIFSVFCMICPLAASWVPDEPFNKLDPHYHFSILHYLAGLVFICCFAGTVVYVSYRRTLYKVQEDLKHQTKTIEQTQITRKQYMPLNNTFYFYLNSPNKLSIEVKQDDYHTMDQGDELNIEYTTYSKLYLGYF